MGGRGRATTGGGRDQGRFFLAADSGGEPRLIEEDERHLTRVLRARVGDRLEGLDGRGGRWPLEVGAVGRKSIELVERAPRSREAPPGAEGARVPAIEVALAPPRPNRVEALLDRLTQLGAARIQFLRADHTGPEDRRPKGERLQRVLRESAKQSGQAWLPELEAPIGVDALPAGEQTRRVRSLPAR
ncbi:MAG: RsmE family RNA methyltransferase, partial [Planctomycetota bacterium]